MAFPTIDIYSTSNTLAGVQDQHLYVNTQSSSGATTGDTKNVRINSRDYTATSGDFTGCQMKPNVSVTGTASVKALEISPRFADGCAGANLIGAFIGTDLKGSGAAGDLSGQINALELKMESASGSTRTVTGGAYGIRFQNGMHGTVTGGIYPIDIEAAGGNAAWSGLIRASASGAGGVMVSADGMFKDPETDAEAGYLKIIVGSTEYQTPFYASA